MTLRKDIKMTNNELKEKFINKFGDPTERYNHREEGIADWWLADRSALLTEIAGEIKNSKIIIIPPEEKLIYTFKFRTGFNAGIDKALSIINSYKNEDKD